jgi:RNA polymerase sigma factor (sigma-70 family)
MDDHTLLREYVDRQSEKAFAELVARYINLVHSTALRIVQETDLAKDVSQSVFILLARKAPTIRSGNALPGWLYRVTRYQAANAVRADRIRREHETEALNMNLTDAESSTQWQSILPHLDDAMSKLGSKDQNAVVLRFFQERSWREVGAALALNEDAAQNASAAPLRNSGPIFCDGASSPRPPCSVRSSPPTRFKQRPRDWSRSSFPHPLPARQARVLSVSFQPVSKHYL